MFVGVRGDGSDGGSRQGRTGDAEAVLFEEAVCEGEEVGNLVRGGGGQGDADVRGQFADECLAEYLAGGRVVVEP